MAGDCGPRAEREEVSLRRGRGLNWTAFLTGCAFQPNVGRNMLIVSSVIRGLHVALGVGSGQRWVHRAFPFRPILALSGYSLPGFLDRMLGRCHVYFWGEPTDGSRTVMSRGN